MLRARTLPAKVSASIASGVYCPQSGRSASLHASKSNSGVLRRSSLGRIIASIERYFGPKSLWRDFAAQKSELQTQRSTKLEPPKRTPCVRRNVFTTTTISLNSASRKITPLGFCWDWAAKQLASAVSPASRGGPRDQPGGA